MIREPMLAARMATIPTGPQWLMEPKFDGWRVMTSTIDGVRLETRTGNVITQVPYIAEAVARALPPDSIIDGEMVALRHPRQWNRTESILSTTRGGYQHKPTADDPPLTYVVFDVLQIAGEDIRHLPLHERKRRLFALLPDLEPDDVLMHCPIHEASDEGVDKLVAEGFEGVVVKDVNGPYVCGGRRHGWGKIKPWEEIEAVCTGTYPADPGSKYAPLDPEGNPKPWAVGGICFRVEHPDGRVYEGRAAGMNDRLRSELHEHPEKFGGLVVELRHWGVHDSGALRHPNYRRFRSPADKLSPDSAAHAGTTRRRTAGPTRPAASATGGQRRIRNYRQMGDPKLLRSIESLRSRAGEAYEKCINVGSGNPAKDLSVAEGIARGRGYDQGRTS